jgi:hypothetical protein
VARDPDAIQREIEQTRAELADTIDAISDRLSPKRVATRGVGAVKATVSSALDRGDGSGGDESSCGGHVGDDADDAALPVRRTADCAW